jgi:hypothetical protein
VWSHGSQIYCCTYAPLRSLIKRICIVIWLHENAIGAHCPSLPLYRRACGRILLRRKAELYKVYIAYRRTNKKQKDQAAPSKSWARKEQEKSHGEHPLAQVALLHHRRSAAFFPLAAGPNRKATASQGEHPLGHSPPAPARWLSTAQPLLRLQVRPLPPALATARRRRAEGAG